jgi:uncharacterized protein
MGWETAMERTLEDLARRYGVADLYAFGSRAKEIAGRVRGEEVPSEYPQSDVDIGVRPLPAMHLTARERVCLTIDLEDMFAAKRVDLVVISEAPPFLALDIIRGELLYCSDADDQAEYELYVLRRAGDLAPLARERISLVFGEDPT